jgi:hypothetical protein
MKVCLTYKFPKLQIKDYVVFDILSFDNLAFGQMDIRQKRSLICAPTSEVD